MPPLQSFTSNPFLTRTHLQTSATSLLRPLLPYLSPSSALLTLPLSTGTHFDTLAASLEGFARPLWAIASLSHSQSLSATEHEELILPFAQGLAAGTDPCHEEYWGPVVLRDQRMVEMEIISFALLAAPDVMFHSQSPQVKQNITNWLKTINGKDMPTTNWLWFRVLTNLALIKVCGVPKEEVQGYMEQDLEVMEGFYRGEGWAADGVWTEEGGRQADYYSGSFAIQFSQLVYVRMAGELDPERCAKFRERAREFAKGFWRYFDGNGAAIPFGRSLTYRFALAAFWSAIAFAEVTLPDPLDDWGVVKGLLLRHFRWWGQKPDMFNCDGTLTIGFTYPNMYLSEDYNSPQSPYWAMKSFIALALPAHHPFWTAAEKPLPSLTGPSTVLKLEPPMHILCNQPNHHFLLSSGQFCPWPLKATEAKYGKYAYSSHFGFSVPTGPLIQQLAPDSTLALSKDGGDTWRVPWKVASPCFESAQLLHNGEVVETLLSLKSTWKPWRDTDVLVETRLIAPSKRWPDWYVRWHTVRNTGERDVQLEAVQGGFAIYGRARRRGEVLPELASTSQLNTSNVHTEPLFPEGTLMQDNLSALIVSSAGASGIRALSTGRGEQLQEQAQVLKPDANTNLMWQRTLIPTISVQVEARCSVEGAQVVQFGCAVFALASTEDRAKRCAYELDVEKLWLDAPVVSTGDAENSEWCIRVA